MTGTFRHFAVQIAATLTITGLLGAALYGVAEFATQGVVA